MAGRPERKDAAPFTIVIPPPNVTGSLHMGHALNNTLQDILCRFERMRGRDVLWQPGTDHAGIATQMVVERQLMERQEPGRRDMGRAKFLERVWQWKAESGGTIVNQLKRLGASCDWSRERFTMDEGLSRAVVKVFVELHREGLIYKDKRLVNWDSEAAHRDLRSRSAAGRGQGQPLVSALSDRGQDFQPRRSLDVCRRGDDAARDDARRHRRCDTSGERTDRASDRPARHPAAGRPPHPDHRRRLRRSREGIRRGQDHAGARFQRLRGRQASRPAADQRVRSRGLPGPRRQRGLSARIARGRADAGGRTARRRPLRRAQEDRGAAGRFRLPGEDRAEHAHGAARRPLQRRSSSPI